MKNKSSVFIFIDTIKNYKFITISNNKNYLIKSINNLKFKTILIDTSSQSHQFYTKDKNIMEEKFVKQFIKKFSLN